MMHCLKCNQDCMRCPLALRRSPVSSQLHPHARPWPGTQKLPLGFEKRLNYCSDSNWMFTSTSKPGFKSKMIKPTNPQFQFLDVCLEWYWLDWSYLTGIASARWRRIGCLRTFRCLGGGAWPPAGLCTLSGLPWYLVEILRIFEVVCFWN